MTKKKINFKPAAEIRASIEKEIDQWVKGGLSSEENTTKATIEDNDQVEKEEKEESYRLSLDIPKYLHKRIKRTCATEEVSMKAKLTELLLNAFPEK
jgi:hypothetical protein